MYKHFTASEVYTTLTTNRIAEIFSEGITTQNTALAFTAFEELRSRGCMDLIAERVEQAFRKNEVRREECVFTVSLVNHLCHIGRDQDGALRDYGMSFMSDPKSIIPPSEWAVKYGAKYTNSHWVKKFLNENARREHGAQVSRDKAFRDDLLMEQNEHGC